MLKNMFPKEFKLNCVRASGEAIFGTLRYFTMVQSKASRLLYNLRHEGSVQSKALRLGAI